MSKLMWLFSIPILASALIFIFSSLISKKKIKRLALAISVLPLLMLLFGGNWIGEQVNYPWFSSIEFYLKLDTLSLFFVSLTAIIIPISLLAAPDFSQTFYGFALLLQGLLFGFFTAHDLALFTIFWEAMLFPLYFIITLWGEERRTALKFLIYMVAGSSLMVAAVLSLYLSNHTFNFDQLATHTSPSWVFAIFVLAFSVKTPLFPFHAWLPDTYAQAPTSGTILLSALLSKAGIYGFLRVGIELFPQMMREWNPWLLRLAIIGVLYGGLAAWRQSDFKRLLAYSSFSHVNFVLAGLFVWNQTAHEGAILQAFNHGITIAGLFLVAGWLSDRLGTTSISSASGVAKLFPKLCWLTLIFVLSSVALPGTNNFIGEVLIFFGLIGQHPYLTAALGLTVILSVMYMLRWMQNVYFEELRFAYPQRGDIKGKELMIAIPLVVFIFLVGIYPAPVLQQIEKSQLEKS